MSYKKQKLILILFIITVVSFYWYGCSQESEKTYNFLDNLGSAEIIADKADYVKAETEFAVNDDKRVVLFEHPNSKVVFKDVPINENSALTFGVGINQIAWDKPGDGVLFEVIIVYEKSLKNVIFSRYIDPKNNVEDKKWLDYNLGLKVFAGQKVSFIFKTTVGPKGDGANDWAGWSSPQITSEGDKETVQIEKTYNFLDNLGSAEIIADKADYVKAETEFAVNDDKRVVLLEHPNSKVVFKDIPVKENSALTFGVGINQIAWDKSGDGVLFEVIIIYDKSQRNVIFSRYIDPKNNVEDKKWLDYNLGLKAFAGQKVSFIFKTTVGPKGDGAYDWAGWSSPQISRGGKETIQVEKTYNFLDNLGSAEIVTEKGDYAKVTKTEFIINNDKRLVLSEHPNSEVVFKDVPIYENSTLEFGVGIDKKAWDKSGDGVLFEIAIVDEKPESHPVFSQYIDPKNNVEDRKWFNNNLGLKAFAGQKVSFMFKTTAGFDKHNTSYDLAGWSRPQVVTYSETSETKKPRHISVITSSGEYKAEKSVETKTVDFGNELHKGHLVEGWLGYGNGKAQDGTTFVWSKGTTSQVEITVSQITNKWVYLRCHPYPGARTQTIKVSINNNPLTVLELVDIWAEYNFSIPASALQSGSNTLTFEYASANSPIAFDYIQIKPAITSKTTVSRRSMNQRPNIIVYLLDALRADHLGAYGYNRPTSPNIDKLAKEGILFENAFAQAPYTLASVISFFTSRYPTLIKKKGRLTDEYVTIAEVLKETGYQTATLSANPYVSNVYGTIQGFDQFLDIQISRELNDSASNISKELPPILEKFTKSKKPFFLYIHSVNPHSPYKPPSPYSNMFRNAHDSPVDCSSSNMNKIRAGEVILSTSDKDSLIAQYDGSILFNDHEIGNLMKMLKELGLVKNTVIIIMSDHGEEFFDHGGIEHGGQLFDELIHIPLIFWNPAIFSQPKRISNPVELVDLMPTLIDLALIQKPDFLDMEGASLLSLLKGGRAGPKEIYSYEPDFDAVAVRSLKWKYIYSPKGMGYGIGKMDTVEWLFDLETDPHEIKNKANKENELASKFRKHALEWLKVQKEKTLDKQVKAPGVELDEATKERLKALGYVQ